MLRPVSIRWFIPLAILMFALVLAACETDDADDVVDVDDTDDVEVVEDDDDAAVDDEDVAVEDDDAVVEDDDDAVVEDDDDAVVDDDDDVAVGAGDWDEPIVFADYGWDSAIVLNRIAQFILEEAYGYETDSVPGETIPLFQGMLSGDVHVSMEIWAAQLEGWSQAIEDGEVHSLGLSIDETVQGWYVPTYMIEGDEERGIDPITPDLQHVDDLPDYVDVFQDPDDPDKGRFYDCIAGWECERVNEVKFEAYGLGEYYNRFLPGSGAALATSIVSAYDSGDQWLGYYWGPTWIFGQVDLTMLEEPEYTDECWENIQTAIEEDGSVEEGCHYPAVEVFVGVTDDIYQAAPDVMALLEQFEFTMEEVSEILLAMHEQDLDPDEGAEWFLRERADKWHDWLPEDAIEDVEAALN